MPLKKKNPNTEDMEVSDDSDSSDNSELGELNEVRNSQRKFLVLNDLTSMCKNFQEIQVDFEGRNPIDSDFAGIRQLLNQLLLKSDVNMSELADYIIGECINVHNSCQ